MTSSVCPVCGPIYGSNCGAQPTNAVIEIRDVPIFCNVLLATQEEARQVAKGDILLEHCPNCGHLFNSMFDAKLVEYGQVYENSLHFSPRFQEYASALAGELVRRYALYGKQIVEIGSGRGDFLKLLCELGDNSGIGFDPSFSPPVGDNGANRVTFVQDIYCERYAGVSADFICSRHTLEHLADPVTFVQTVRRAIGERCEVPVYIEVPNALYTLRDLGIWDLLYEHPSYFCASSLRHLFVANGFREFHGSDRYGGQFLSIEVIPAATGTLGAATAHHDASGGANGGANDTARFVGDFRREYLTKVERMRATLESIRHKHQRCVLWGAGSKGVTFLNVMRVRDEIGYIVDINPRKQGKYVAGSGQQIVAPEFLMEYRPDVVMVMNPIYLDEITATLHGMGLSAQLLVV